MEHIPEKPPKTLPVLLWLSFVVALEGAATAHLVALLLTGEPAPRLLAPWVGLASGLLGLAVLIARRPSDDLERARAKETSATHPRPMPIRKRSRWGAPKTLGLISLGLFGAVIFLIAVVPRALEATGIEFQALWLPIGAFLVVLAMICGGAGLLTAILALGISIFRVLRGDEENEPTARRRGAGHRRRRAERSGTES